MQSTTSFLAHARSIHARTWQSTAMIVLASSTPTLAQSHTVSLVSVGSQGQSGNASSSARAIAGDGRSVAFVSSASNLVPNDTNALRDVFVRDMSSGTTARVSVSSAGIEANGALDFDEDVAISADGSRVAFSSQATISSRTTRTAWPMCSCTIARAAARGA